jgi:hypothetical protein
MASIAATEFGSDSAAFWLQAQLSQQASVLKSTAQALIREALVTELQDTESQVVAEMKARLAGALPDVFLKAADSALVAALDNPGSRLASKFKSHGGLIDSLTTRVALAETRLEDIASIDKQMDDKYPWRSFERTCSSKTWSAAWDRVLVDCDWIENIGNHMGDPALANAMTVVLQNPESEEAARMWDSVTFKKATKKSWEQLALPPLGGLDRLRGFLADKIEQSNDTAVTAVAQKVYAYLLVMETQLVDMESDASPEAISIQRMTLMPLVLRGIGAMRRYAKKSAARKPLEVALLTKDFLLPCVLALAAAANDSEGANSGPEWGTGGSDHEAASRKRPRDVTSASAVAAAQAQLRAWGAPFGNDKGGKANGKAGKAASKGKGSNDMYVSVKNDLQWYLSNRPAHDVNAYVDAKLVSASTEEQSAIKKILGDYCKHCIRSGRELVQHSRSECKAAGNDPGMKCPRCSQWGHWAEDCSR